MGICSVLLDLQLLCNRFEAKQVVILIYCLIIVFWKDHNSISQIKTTINDPGNKEYGQGYSNTDNLQTHRKASRPDIYTKKYEIMVDTEYWGWWKHGVTTTWHKVQTKLLYKGRYKSGLKIAINDLIFTMNTPKSLE